MAIDCDKLLRNTWSNFYKSSKKRSSSKRSKKIKKRCCNNREYSSSSKQKVKKVSDFTEVSDTGGAIQSKVKKPKPVADTDEPAVSSERSKINLFRSFKNCMFNLCITLLFFVQYNLYNFLTWNKFFFG